jgi:hypothetical protein
MYRGTMPKLRDANLLSNRVKILSRFYRDLTFSCTLHLIYLNERSCDYLQTISLQL